MGGLSYFGGAEKKDGSILVPDLGSLTSIYDRWVFEAQEWLLSIYCFILRVLFSCGFCNV